MQKAYKYIHRPFIYKELLGFSLNTRYVSGIIEKCHELNGKLYSDFYNIRENIYTDRLRLHS